jgi:septum formation protein
MNILSELQNKYHIILASQSPRRINLLKSLRLIFDVLPANIDENLDTNLKPAHYCKSLALKKAQIVLNSIDDLNRNELIIAADTIVVLAGEIINKPKDKINAFNILKKLSNNYHFVYTGIAVADNISNKIITNHSRTIVYFRKLSDSEIWEYIESGKPMDKAGAYGIQDDYGALFVKRIEGCYNNVIGLPLELLFKMLHKYL